MKTDADIQADLDAAANAGGGVVRLQGTYRIHKTVTVPAGVSLDGGGGRLVGDGRHTVLTAQNNRSGNRHTYVRDLEIDGGGLSDRVVYLGVVVQRQFSNLNIVNSNSRGEGLLIDGAQNCEFIGLGISNHKRGLRLMNGTGSNMFLRTEIESCSETHLDMGLDTTLPNKSAGFRRPTSNAFMGCIFERGRPNTRQGAKLNVDLVQAKLNAFYHCTFSQGTEGGNALKLWKPSGLNEFHSCNFSKRSSAPVVDNAGWNNKFENPTVEGGTRGAVWLVSSNQCVVMNPHIVKGMVIEDNGSGSGVVKTLFSDGRAWRIGPGLVVEGDLTVEGEIKSS